MTVAVVATYDTRTAVSTREDVSDAITNIDPTETPVVANLAQNGSVKNPDLHEWQTDAYLAPSAAGQVDGVLMSAAALPDAAGTAGVDARLRYGAPCQIQAYGLALTGRQQMLDQAGIEDEKSYQIARAGAMLTRDMEATIATFRTPVAPASGVAPLFAGIPTWIRTNTDRGAGGADPTVAGTPLQPVIGTDGTIRAADESLILDLLRQVYDEGGNTDMICVGTQMKQRFSNFYFTSGSGARIATPYQSVEKGDRGAMVQGAVDLYVSDFGTVAVVPSRFQRARDILILDTSVWEIAKFRDFQVTTMGRRGDLEEEMLLHDYTIVCYAEQANAIFADADGSTAMVA